MFRTDKASRLCMPSGVLILLMLLIVGGLKAQSTYMACNNQVNVSLSEDCSVIITADMILEGEDNYDPPYNDLSSYIINITTNSGSGISGTEITIPGIYVVEITEIISGYENSCWGTLLVEDKLPPEFVDDPATPINEACPCPVGNDNPDCNLKVTCAGMEEMLAGYDHTPIPAYTDCSPTTLSFIDVVVEEGPCYPTKIQRQYVVSDAYGNKSTSCIMEYTVDPIDVYTDIHDPVSPLELPCYSDFSTQSIYDFYYQEKLDYLLPYATTDDEIAEAHALANAYANHHAYPTIYYQPITSTVCNVVVSKSDLTVPACEACPDVKKLIRTWLYTDWCTGAQHEFTQLIVNGDSGGPSISAQDFTASVDPWGCYGTFYMPPPYHLHDSCSDNVSYDITGPPGAVITWHEGVGYHVTNAPKGVHTFYYNGYDCCGNVAVAPVTVTIVDATPPVAVAYENIVVSLTTATAGTGIAKLYNTSVDNGSHDGCGPVKLEIRREYDNCAINGNTTYNNDGHQFDDEYDDDDGEYVKFCCEDLDSNGVDEDGDGIFEYSLYKVWLRVWDDGDMDGVYGSAGDHYNEAWSYVRLENKVPPSLLCPADITVDCDVDIYDLAQVGSATGYTACGNAEVDYIDEYTGNNACAHGLIYRKWFIVNNPYSYCVQKIYREAPDYGDDIVVHFPQDTLVDCTADLEDLHPYWYAPVCNLLAYSLDSDTFYFEEGACMKIRNEWTVIDWCTYEPNADYPIGIWEHTQIVKIIDEVKPEIADCEETIMVEANDHGDSDGDGITCENNAVMLTKSATDLGDCGSDWLKWTVQIDLWADWTYDYVFSSNGDPESPFHLPHTSSGEEVKVTLPDGVPGSMQNHRVIWKVTDGCGNITSCTQYFMVVDKKAPTPYCVNVSSALMDDGEIELWACDFDLGSFDNCSENEDLRFTFTSTHPDDDLNYNASSMCSSRTFTCDDIIDAGLSPVEVTVYVWDEKDNVDFCTVYLTLIDNFGVCGESGASRIGGQIITESGKELNQISVELMSSIPSYPLYETTDSDGKYSFDNIPMSFDYQISGLKNDDYTNGVSTLDLVLIQKHILSLQLLDSPYKRIAADANDDEKISSIDLLELRKLILGVYDELPKNDSWRFPIKSQSMDNNDPWPFVETISIDNFATEMMDNDFVGVKIGDVNGTATLGLVGEDDTESRSNNHFGLYYDDVISNLGSTTIPVKAGKNVLLQGIQFTLSHANSKLARIEGGSLAVEAVNFAAGVATTNFSWNALKPLDIYEGEVLFSIVLDGELNSPLAISKSGLESEVYVGSNLDVQEVKLTHSVETLGNQLFQNSPNPFSGITTIGFSLSENGPVSLKLFDVNGKLIRSVQDDYQAGYHEIKLNAKDFANIGVVYYQMETDGFTATKKMIIID